MNWLSKFLNETHSGKLALMGVFSTLITAIIVVGMVIAINSISGCEKVRLESNGKSREAFWKNK